MPGKILNNFRTLEVGSEHGNYLESIEIHSKYCRAISSKFPRSFRGAGDSVVLGEFSEVNNKPEK